MAEESKGRSIKISCSIVIFVLLPLAIKGSALIFGKNTVLLIPVFLVAFATMVATFVSIYN